MHGYLYKKYGTFFCELINTYSKSMLQKGGPALLRNASPLRFPPLSANPSLPLVPPFQAARIWPRGLDGREKMDA